MPHAELDVERDVIRFQTTWNQKDLIRQVPGARWDAELKNWIAPLTWTSVIVARGIFGEQFTVGPKLTDWSWREYNDRILPSLELRDALVPLDDGSPEHRLIDSWVGRDGKRGLYEFQAAGVQFMLRAESGLLGDEMGAGKTPQTASLIRAHEALDGTGLPALVICPNSVKHHWANDVTTWLPEGTPYVVEGTAAQRRKVLKAALHDSQAVVIINIESVRLFTRLAPYGSVKLTRCRECDPRTGDEGIKASRCEVHRKELNEFDFRTVVLDEAHRVKDPKAKQTRAIWYVAHQESVRWRWALTGTPIANHPGDLWSIMHMVAPREYPTRSTHVDRFCTPPDSMIWMGDGTFKQIGDVLPGDIVMGFSKTPVSGKGKHPRYEPTRVTATNRRRARLVRVYLDNGDSFLCTPDHRWLTEMRRRSNNGPRIMEFSEPIVGMRMRHIIAVPPCLSSDLERDAAWLGGVWDGEGTYLRIAQSSRANPAVYERIGQVLDKLGISYSKTDDHYLMLGGRDTFAKFLHYCRPVKRTTPAHKAFLNGSLTGEGGSERWGSVERRLNVRITKIEPTGEGDVISLTTETETYIVHGYASHNCLMSWNAFGGMDVVGVRPDTRDELFKVLDPRFRRMLKAVVLPQLPPKVREVRYAEMSPAQMRAYRELGTQLRTRLPDGQLLVATNQLVAKTRLMQFAAASVTVEKPDVDDVASWRVALREPSPKLDVLDEVLDELGLAAFDYAGAPVLIAAEHLDMIDLVCARLDGHGVRNARITGEVAPIDRQRALDALNAGSIRALVFTGKAGGVGLNMSAADTLINVQRSWSLVDERQKEDRNHRVGSERHDSVRIIDIVTKDTVEEDQVTRLHEKLLRLDEVTRDRAALLTAGQLSAATIAHLDQQETLLLATAIDLDDDLNVTARW